MIEATGTGGGFKLFCSGLGNNTPDIANASRKIKQGELKLCRSNGVEKVLELKVGYDGIVLATGAQSGFQVDITKQQLFLALAKRVPQNNKLVENPYEKWSDIDPSLPDIGIEVLGPPPTSGTRDAFVELVMEKGCAQYLLFEATYPDTKKRKEVCHQIREDGRYVDTGENDNLIVQKLTKNDHALGIFGYSFLDQNREILKPAKINGVNPTFDTISAGSYQISRPLYVYVKHAHIEKIAGLKEFLGELASEEAIGDFGYLTYKGLIPLIDQERRDMRQLLEKNS